MEEDEEKEGQESNGGAVAEVISGTDTWAEFARMAMRLRPLSAGEGGGSVGKMGYKERGGRWRGEGKAGTRKGKGNRRPKERDSKGRRRKRRSPSLHPFAHFP